jgi:menaquinol-cytochrome c reductase iron-sulfur subunit
MAESSPKKGPKHSASTSSASPLSTPKRRGFLTAAAAVVIGAIVTIFPFAAGMFSFLSPANRAGKAGKEVRIIPLDQLPDDGVPHRYPVIADMTDAWTKYVNEPIGAVYLMRNKGSSEVLALNAICPHAGCFVNYETSKHLFQCPCHTSAFDVAGKRRLDISEVPPRDMDKLECQVKDGEVWVNFMNFKTGREDQSPKA